MTTSPLNTMIAQPFTMPAIKITVTDADGTRTPTFDARVCRMFLASVSGGGASGRNSGTAADPDEWIKGSLEFFLNDSGALTNWTCDMTTEGKCRITYNAAGVGTITWDDSGGSASVIPRNLAGHELNIALSSGASVTGTEHVTHAVFGFNMRNMGTGLMPIPKRAALADTDDGRQYGWTATRQRYYFRSNWGFHPRNASIRDNELSGQYKQTVALPTIKARWTQPSATPSAINSPPWSLSDFFGTVHGGVCGWTDGNLQQLVAGSQSEFVEVTVAAETLTAPGNFVVTEEHNGAWVDVKNVLLNYVQHTNR